MGYWTNIISPVEIHTARNLNFFAPTRVVLDQYRPLAACILTLNYINFGNRSVMTLKTGVSVSVFLSRSGQMPFAQLCCDWCLHHVLSCFLCWRLQCWLMCPLPAGFSSIERLSVNSFGLPINPVAFFWF